MDNSSRAIEGEKEMTSSPKYVRHLMIMHFTLARTQKGES